jgi:hypothetical protein
MFFSLKINQDTSFRGWTRIIHPNLQKDTENTSAWLKDAGDAPAPRLGSGESFF